MKTPLRRTVPYPYQEWGLNRIERFQGRALLSFEMGLGKTPVALWYLQRHAEIKRAVVVCPASMKYIWQREATHHIGVPAEILESRRPPRKGGLPFRSRLLIINYEILAWWVDWLMDYNPQLLIADEGHYLKTRNALRTKAFRYLSKKTDANHILLLTGTPILSRPAELWPLLNILRPDIYRHFRPFAKEFCCLRRTPWGMEANGAVRLPKLHRELRATVMVRKKKSEVLDQLPPKTRHVVPLGIEKPEEYRAAVSNFLGWLRKISPTLARRAAKAEKVVQLSYMKTLVAQLKKKTLFDWIDNFFEESNEKLLLFGIHKKMLDALQERYKKIAVRVDGGVVGKKRQIAFDRFNTDKKVRLFLGNVQAAGVGWSCRSTSTVAFCEFPWTPGLLTQAEDRIHGIKRGVEGKKAQIYYLVAQGTVEEDLCRLLQKKQKILSKVLDGGPMKDDLDIHDRLIELLSFPSAAKTLRSKPKKRAV